MFCCGCNRSFVRPKRKKFDNGLVGQVCLLKRDGRNCDSEDIFTNRSMQQWHAQKRREQRFCGRTTDRLVEGGIE